MTRRLLLPCVLLGLIAVSLVLAACSSQTAAVRSVRAAPQVFSGPVNGGCYLDTITTCRFHIDNWQPIVTDPAQKLLGFRLLAIPEGAATGSILYDFRTDVSNPPGGSYLPSLVKKDFAAQCSATYRLSLSARDSGDLDYEEVGRTEAFTCPTAATATPTAIPSPTATVDGSPTPTATPDGTPEPAWRLYLPAVRRDT